MANQTRAITAHEGTREGQVIFSKQKGGGVQCVVVVEFDDGDSQAHRIDNAILDDTASVYTEAEFTQLKQLLKKAYDYGIANITWSTP